MCLLRNLFFGQSFLTSRDHSVVEVVFYTGGHKDRFCCLLLSLKYIIWLCLLIGERIVNVGGTECPCGGTHVKNTSWIRGMSITKIKKVRKINNVVTHKCARTCICTHMYMHTHTLTRICARTHTQRGTYSCSRSFLPYRVTLTN